MKHIFEYLFSKKTDLDKIRTNRFGITEKDMIGSLKGFPVGVVVGMMEEQENQGNKPDVKVFQRKRSVNKHGGGFDWVATKDTHNFWSKVITGRNFNAFYEKYPEYKKYDL